MNDEYTVASGQTLNDVPTTNTKAIAGGVTATVLAFLTGLGTAMDNGVTGQEWVTIAIGTVAAGATAFGITYNAPTRVK